MFGLSKRTLRSKLPKTHLSTIQRGTMAYTYRGISCLKNPFDLAIYQLLIADLQPKTIVEVGSAKGGSALWLSDVTQNHGLDTSIISVDINPVRGLTIDRVQFIYGDIHKLSESALPDLLKICERPLLVIEDGPHTFEGCKAALEFFHPYMAAGEYIIIEDGIVFELGHGEYKDGPNRAIAQHVKKHSKVCKVDREMCDYFGQNFTWATNGYIRYKR